MIVQACQSVNQNINMPKCVLFSEILKFAPPPVNKKLELGSTAKIHCKAQGTPPPTIRWEKEGVGVENMANHIADMNGTLHFNGVLDEDKGRYTCTASNSQGKISVTVNIDVVGECSIYYTSKQLHIAFFGE